MQARAGPARQNEPVEIAEHIEALHEQGNFLADASDRAGLEAAVAPCPPWLVKDLLRHTGHVHRWAARHIAECPASILDGPPEEEMLASGAADRDLVTWFRAGHAALVETLATADPGLECATLFGAPSALGFWARRQAHETAIHRADAESAVGERPEYAPEFAADGVDELIMGFGARRKYRPSSSAVGEMQISAADTGDAWHLSVADGRIQAHRGRGPGPGGNMVSGPASGLYLFLWNRSEAGPAGVTISGDDSVLVAWRSSVRVRWS